MKNDIRKTQLKEGEIIPLNFDFVFEAIFTKKENIDILESFLACYFDIEISKIKGRIKILPRELELESKKAKNKQIDLLLELEDETINIELNNKYSKGIKERNIVFASNVHSRSLKYSDNDYSEIKRTIQINLNVNLRNQNNKLKDKYYLRNEEGKILSEKFEIDNLDMALGREICYNDYNNKLARWCTVLTAKTKEEFRKNLGEDLMEKETKSKLVDETMKYSTDEDVVALYFEKSKEELEYNTLIADARQSGIELGIKRGIEQGKIETTKKMLETATNFKKLGVDIETISKATGLSKEEIEKL